MIHAAEIYKFIVDNDIASEDAVSLVVDINGMNHQTLNDVIYSRTGYRSIEDLYEDEKDSYDFSMIEDIDE